MIVGDDTLPLLRGLEQKIALAAALYEDPRVLVLDHPPAYCVEHGRRAVRDEVKRLRSNSGIIIIAAYTDEEPAMALTASSRRPRLMRRPSGSSPAQIACQMKRSGVNPRTPRPAKSGTRDRGSDNDAGRAGPFPECPRRGVHYLLRELG